MRSQVVLHQDETVSDIYAHLSDFTFEFKRVSGELISDSVFLLANGAIYGPHSPNESFWRVENETLKFFDRSGNVTTEFHLVVDGSGWRLEGKFLLDPNAQIIHVLTPVSSEPQDWRWKMDLRDSVPELAKCLFLIRAHKYDSKVQELAHQLAALKIRHDVVIYLDNTNLDKDIDENDVIVHNLEEFRSIGLMHNHPRLMWWFGDFPFYTALNKLDHYKYYFVIEYDVHISSSGAESLLALADDLARGSMPDVHAIGTRLRLETSPDDNLHRAAWSNFEKVYSFFFPFIGLSRKAVEFLYLRRLLELASGTDDRELMYCESFVPSALHDAGFGCVDFNFLIKNFYRNDMMIARNRVGGLSSALAVPLEKFSKILHPVYSQEELLAKATVHIQDNLSLGQFVEMLRAGDFGLVEEERIATLREDLEKRIAS